MKEITEKILRDFINRLQGARKPELVNDFIDINNRPEMELITFDQLFENLGGGINMNFFPSENKGACCEVAMFVSFHKPLFGLKFKKGQMISLDDVIKKLVQQVLSTCYPKNQNIILLTDKVDTDIFEPWLGNLKSLKKINIEIDIVYWRNNGSFEFVNKLVGL
jgi:hypothetical protein